MTASSLLQAGDLRVIENYAEQEAAKREVPWTKKYRMSLGILGLAWIAAMLVRVQYEYFAGFMIVCFFLTVDRPRWSLWYIFLQVGEVLIFVAPAAFAGHNELASYLDGSWQSCLQLVLLSACFCAWMVWVYLQLPIGLAAFRGTREDAASPEESELAPVAAEQAASPEELEPELTMQRSDTRTIRYLPLLPQ